jgi:acyl carrier protein
MVTLESISEPVLKAKLIDFIITNFLFGDVTKKPSDGDSLINTGVLDSTGILELIQFLEENYSIEVKDTETLPQNLDSIDNIVRFVQGKSQRSL